MSFFLPKGLREFFDFQHQRMFASTDGGKIGDRQLILFDGFYASLLIGVTRAGMGKKQDLEIDHFVPNYPREFSATREYIAALIVDAELSRKTTKEYKQADFEREISKLLRVDAPTRLSDTGIELVNLYAAGGFAFLEERLRPRPTNTTNFLVRFHNLWSEEPSSS